MYQVLGQAPGGGALSSSQRCSLKFSQASPPLFSKRRPPKRNNTVFPRRNGRSKPITLAAAEPAGSGGPRPTSTTSNIPGPLNSDDGISVVGQENVPLEGVIQFEKPNSSSVITKWGQVALLAGGDVVALLLFSAIGRFNHGFSVFDPETFKTADPFIAGWFLSAYFLGGYGEDGRGMNGLFKAFIAATKSWSLGIPLGLTLRAMAVGHVPPVNFIFVTMGSTAVLLIGWRTLLFSIFPKKKSSKNDVYKQGSPFELFELLTSLVRRW